jgi:hypothetical protein
MLSGLCQASCIAARMVQRSVSSCSIVVALFFLIYPRAWEADQQKCSPFFLSLGHCRTGSLMGLRAGQTRATRPLESSLHAALAGIHRGFIACRYPRGCPAATTDRLHNILA